MEEYLETLKGKLVLVTGSTEGIGKAIAVAFAKQGAHVIINSRSEKKVTAVVEELKGTSNRDHPL